MFNIDKDLYEVITLDCRKTGNDEVLQECLRQIKPLAKYDSELMIPLNLIEKVIVTVCKKYNVAIGLITVDIQASSNNVIWRAAIDECIEANIYKRLLSVHGTSLYELMAKTAIYVYVKRKEVGKREEG